MSHPIVIIGGGKSGISAAYELAVRGERPLLLEKAHLASMASGWTLGGVRQSGRHPAELPLAKAAVQRWSTLNEELQGETHYRQQGNLRIARNEGEAARILAVAESTRTAGIDIDYLPDAAAVQALAPAVSPSIHSASLCPSDGHADPFSTVQSYAAAAERQGAIVRTGIAVTSIETSGGRITGVITNEGRLACDRLVLAAGVYTPRLLGPLGIDFPLTVTIVIAVQSVPVHPFLSQVLGVATGNVAARQEVNGSLRLTGGSREWPPGLDALKNSDDAVQPTPSDLASVREVAIDVLPLFDQLRVRRVWGGLIDQTPDALPVYTASTGIDGLIVGAGFSGHGFGIGPVTGEILADLTANTKSRFDLTPFRLERFSGHSSRESVELHG